MLVCQTTLLMNDVIAKRRQTLVQFNTLIDGQACYIVSRCNCTVMHFELTSAEILEQCEQFFLFPAFLIPLEVRLPSASGSSRHTIA